MKSSIVPCLLAGLMLVLAACQDPVPRLTFEGVSTSAGVESPLELSIERHGDRLSGEYTVGAASGSYAGTVVGTVVTAELEPSETCVYSFTGALSDTSLQGAFEPSACPGGQSGTWTLTRR